MVTGARCTMEERSEAVKEAVSLVCMGHKHTLRFQEIILPRAARWCGAIDFASGGDARTSTRREGCPVPEALVLERFAQSCPEPQVYGR